MIQSTAARRAESPVAVDVIMCDINLIAACVDGGAAADAEMVGEVELSVYMHPVYVCHVQ